MSRRAGRRALAALVALAVLGTSVAPAYAKCETDGGFFDIQNVSWDCMLPIKVASVAVVPKPSGVPPDGLDYFSVTPVCVCVIPSPPYFRVGVVISYYEPARQAEIVQEKYCFPALGMNRGSDVADDGRGDGFSSSDQHSEDGERYAFYQGHWVLVPLMYILGLFVDSMCMESNGLDVAYVTEIDPFWGPGKGEKMSAILTPESTLFKSRVMHLFCIADCISATVWLPLDPLFWCVGCWGASYPLAGVVHGKTNLQDAAHLAGRMLYKMHREGLEWGTYTVNGLCGQYVFPIWLKSRWRIALSLPVPQKKCMTIGTSGLLWDYFKDRPYHGNNYSFLFYKKRTCCAM